MGVKRGSLYVVLMRRLSMISRVLIYFPELWIMRGAAYRMYGLIRALISVVLC